MNSSPSVAVIILSWNGSKLLQQFLPSVTLHSNYANIKVIVADNCSSDNSERTVKQFQDVQWLPLDKNYGFAEGYNQVIQKTDADYIVLLNQDVEVTANWIQPVIELMENDRTIAAVQPKIKSFSNRKLFEYAGAAGGWMDKYGYPFCRGRIFDSIEEDKGQYNDVTEIAWASGACMFVRKKSYEQCGGLDADLFAHMEEIDLCWRMKNEGYKIFYTSSSTVFHLGGASLPQGNPFKTYLNFRNSLIILYKNSPKGTLLSLFIVRLLLDKLAAIRFLLKGNFSDWLAVMKAWIHFIGGLGKSRIKRKQMMQRTLHPNKKGFYNRSIVIEYFVKKRKIFSRLPEIKK